MWYNQTNRAAQTISWAWGPGLGAMLSPFTYTTQRRTNLSTTPKYTHIIWDWNGTLFNDVDWCVDVINTMLSKRRIKTLRDISEYRSVFRFPVIEYYRDVGFDFDIEPFDVLAEEYIELYHTDKSGNCELFTNAEGVLDSINSMGITQVVLSASEKSNLLSQMSGFNIGSYFDEVLGLTDIYAKSKLDIGKDYMLRKNIGKVLLIGDTKHDYEVAQALGADCVLISNGHQGRATLESCGVIVLDDISHVVEYIDKYNAH